MDVQHYLADISLKTMSRVHRTIVQLSGGKILTSGRWRYRPGASSPRRRCSMTRQRSST